MKKFGLIGFPLGHSFSQGYFNKKFKAEDIDAEYVNFEIPSIEDFPALVAGNPNLYGLNVTIPYKQQVISYLDSLDEKAAEIGAVNVIKVVRDEKDSISRLVGYNSDVIGFMDSIRALIRSHHTKALVLGTGGASKAVDYGLRSLGMETAFVSRSKEKGQYTYAGLKLNPEIVTEHSVIVNTTPVGMYPNIDECPDLPYEAITPRHLCYDVLYNPDTTLFMKKCAERGATVKNGLEMLLMQAFAAWNIWNS